MTRHVRGRVPSASRRLGRFASNVGVVLGTIVDVIRDPSILSDAEPYLGKPKRAIAFETLVAHAPNGTFDGIVPRLAELHEHDMASSLTMRLLTQDRFIVLLHGAWDVLVYAPDCCEGFHPQVTVFLDLCQEVITPVATMSVRVSWGEGRTHQILGVTGEHRDGMPAVAVGVGQHLAVPDLPGPEPARASTGNQGVLGHGEYGTVASYAIRETAALARTALLDELARHSARTERLWPVADADGIVVDPEAGLLLDLGGAETGLVPGPEPRP